MSKIFFTSDIWFNRPAGDYEDKSVEEYNSMIIDNWNSIVSKDDTVYILGGIGIGDVYPLYVQLNGKLHFLNSTFTQGDNETMMEFQNAILASFYSDISTKLHFEDDQIMAIKESDCIISYLPLLEWGGRENGVYCVHGMTEKSDFKKNRVNCSAQIWKFRPIELSSLKSSLKSFKKIAKM